MPQPEVFWPHVPDASERAAAVIAHSTRGETITADARWRQAATAPATRSSSRVCLPSPSMPAACCILPPAQQDILFSGGMAGHGGGTAGPRRLRRCRPRPCRAPQHRRRFGR
eukprot:17590-Chlamydomonas_euryale.AAC.7